MFAGNVREHTTLQGMLEGLGAPADALVVMDRGIATEAQIAWLRESGYRYLVVSRQRKREFDAEAAEPLATASGHTLHLDRRVCEDTRRRHSALDRRTPDAVYFDQANRNLAA